MRITIDQVNAFERFRASAGEASAVMNLLAQTIGGLMLVRRPRLPRRTKKALRKFTDGRPVTANEKRRALAVFASVARSATSSEEMIQ